MEPRDDLLKLENQLCFALVTAARNVVSIYRPILEPLGLTHPQYLVMLALWERSPRSLGELADELALEPATLSPLVKRLEAQGGSSRTRRATTSACSTSRSPTGSRTAARRARRSAPGHGAVGMDAARSPRCATRSRRSPVAPTGAAHAEADVGIGSVADGELFSCPWQLASAPRLAIDAPCCRRIRALAAAAIGPITEEASCDLGHTRSHPDRSTSHSPAARASAPPPPSSRSGAAARSSRPAGARPRRRRCRSSRRNDFHGRIEQPTDAAGGRRGARRRGEAAARREPEHGLRGRGRPDRRLDVRVVHPAATSRRSTRSTRRASRCRAVGNHELDQGYADLVDRVMAPYDAVTNPYGGASGSTSPRT